MDPGSFQLAILAGEHFWRGSVLIQAIRMGGVKEGGNDGIVTVGAEVSQCLSFE